MSGLLCLVAWASRLSAAFGCFNKMRVGDQESFVEFEFKAREVDDSPQARAVSCSVIAKVKGGRP